MEDYLEQQRLPYTVFQPLYIYGAYTAKDCEQWFMDRILRYLMPANSVWEGGPQAWGPPRDVMFFWKCLYQGFE